MPWVAPVVAYVDYRLGFLYCAHCEDTRRRVDNGRPHLVEKYADDSSIDGEICDTCGTVLKLDTTTKVHV